jgi:hypothetical protein
MLLKPIRYEYPYPFQLEGQSSFPSRRDFNIAQSLNDALAFLAALLGGKEYLLSLLKKRIDSRTQDFIEYVHYSYVPVLIRLINPKDALSLLDAGTIVYNGYDIEVGDDSEVTGITRHGSKEPAPELLYVLLSRYVTDKL